MITPTSNQSAIKNSEMERGDQNKLEDIVSSLNTKYFKNDSKCKILIFLKKRMGK